MNVTLYAPDDFAHEWQEFKDAMGRGVSSWFVTQVRKELSGRRSYVSTTDIEAIARRLDLSENEEGAEAYKLGKDEAKAWAANNARAADLRGIASEDPDNWMGEMNAPHTAWGWLREKYPSLPDFEGEDYRRDRDERVAPVLDSYLYEFLDGFTDGAMEILKKVEELRQNKRKAKN